MTILPIVVRELRVASRRRSTYWLRAGAALLVIIVGTWIFLMLRQETSPAELSSILFGVLTGGAVLYCLLSGIRSTSDCLSQEKREGTLGLLFLTDLKGYDVVLGKLTANSLNSLYGVLAVVPMLAIPLLMGGLTLGEFGRMALVALDTLFLSLTVGLFISAFSRSARRAVGLTFFLLLLFTGVFPALGAWLAYEAHQASSAAGRPGQNSPIESFFLIPSAGYSYYCAWDTVYKSNRLDFWWSLAVIHGLSWVFLSLASLVAPQSWQDRPAGAKRLRWRERWAGWSYGSVAERSGFRRRLLERSAFFWLAARARLKPAIVWAVMGLMGCGWVWGLAKWGHDWLTFPMYLTTAILLHLLLIGWFATEAGRQLAEDRRQGTLELLLSTPLTVREILRGQALALQRQFLGPGLLVLVLDALFLIGTLSDDSSVTGGEMALWICLWVGGMVTLVADLTALYWLGMWNGLTAKNPNRAVSSSLACVVFLPCALWAVGVLLANLASTHGETPYTWKFYMGSWFGLKLAADTLFATWSRDKLRSQFRSAAAQRYVRAASRWKKLLRGGRAEEVRLAIES